MLHDVNDESILRTVGTAERTGGVGSETSTPSISLAKDKGIFETFNVSLFNIEIHFTKKSTLFSKLFVGTHETVEQYQGLSGWSHRHAHWRGDRKYG